MFKEFLHQHMISEKKIAVGVSGGSDSLALVLMAAEELQPLGYHLVALTVNHLLRPSATEEANYVRKIMNAHHIEHHILTWEDENKPQTGIEEAARDARYELISNWCHENKVFYLMMAHHLQDQVETFFLRLHRGSGLDGLCGMSEVTERKGLKILRPFLNYDKNVFKKYLTDKNILWIEDESNSCEALLRVKFRQSLPEFYLKTGLNDRIIAQTMCRLQRSRFYIDNQVEAILSNNLKVWGKAGYSLDLGLWKNLESELQFRLTGKILKTLGRLTYPPRAQKLFNLISALDTPHFKSSTLGGCEVILYDQQIWFVRTNLNLPAYSKSLWHKYLEEHPELKQSRIPFKMRVALLLSASKKIT